MLSDYTGFVVSLGVLIDVTARVGTFQVDPAFECFGSIKGETIRQTIELEGGKKYLFRLRVLPLHRFVMILEAVLD